MSTKNGIEVENEFVSLKEFSNLEIIKATEEQNKLEHWDWSIDNVKYDVKSQKKVNRYDSNPSNEYTYVEFTTYNHRGWIYGKADKIAFEFCDSFIITDREKLFKLVCDNMSSTGIYDRPMEYCYYRRKRKNSSDLLMLVPIRDIVEISDKIIQK